MWLFRGQLAFFHRISGSLSMTRRKKSWRLRTSGILIPVDAIQANRSYDGKLAMALDRLVKSLKPSRRLAGARLSFGPLEMNNFDGEERHSSEEEWNSVNSGGSATPELSPGHCGVPPWIRRAITVGRVYFSAGEFPPGLKPREWTARSRRTLPCRCRYRCRTIDNRYLSTRPKSGHWPAFSFT